MDKLLSRNSDGVVDYRVIEREDGHRELVRIYPAEAFRDPVLAARFRERLQVLSQGSFDGIPTLSMELRSDGRIVVRRPFIDGESLHRFLKNRRLSEDEAVDLLRRMVRVLIPLHQEGIAFGNLTPRHVIIGQDGRLTLVNIRLLETLPENLSFHEEQFAYLTRYAAPECALGETAGRPADLYALGIILYEMLHGVTPYEHEDPVMTAWGHVNRLPEIRTAAPRLAAILQKLLAKDPAKRPARLETLLEMLDGAGEPADTGEETDEVRRAYLGSLRERYRPLLENWRQHPQQAVLTAMMGLILLLVPVIWLMQTGRTGTVFRIDPAALFRESFRSEYLPALRELPAVQNVTTEGSEACIRLKLDKDRAFLEKLQEIFSSGIRPRCEFDLSGSREIRIRYTAGEMARRLQHAMADLQDKLQSRLRRERLEHFTLTLESPQTLRLQLPAGLPAETRQRLLARRSLSLHLLRNGTNESQRTDTGEILLTNAVEARFARLLLDDPARIRQRAPRDEDIHGIFWNLLGQFNLQNPPPRVERMLTPLPVLFEPAPESATDFSLARLVDGSAYLVVSPEPVCDPAVISGSRIRFSVDRRFIFQLGNRYGGEKRPGAGLANLPLVLAEGGMARAVIFNPGGRSADDGLILGFPSPRDLFDFAGLFEAALPAWVVVE